MKSLFQSIKARRREVLIKESITTELMASVKDVQLYKQVSQVDSSMYYTSDEAAKYFVTVLEAMFIHDVKETFADRMSSVLGDPDHKPSPEFWSPMMVVTHSHVINQVNRMSQIVNDVGRSRSWLRTVLNDGMLVCYLSAIAHKKGTISSFYKKTAYLLDSECLTVTLDLLQGISQFFFSYPTNSSVLNHWPNEPLLMAGLWTPPMKDCPAALGFDIAKTIPDTVQDVVEEVATDLRGALMMDHDEALKIILNTPVDGSPLQSGVVSLAGDVEEGATSSELPAAGDLGVTVDSGVEEEEEVMVGAVTDQAIQPAEETNEVPREEMPQIPDESLASYDAVLDSYIPQKTPLLLENDLNSYMERIVPNAECPSPESDANICEMGYEIVEKTSLPSGAKIFKTMINLVKTGKIAREVGLDSQKFSCRSCGNVIGITHIKSNVCAFTGFYYCPDCFKGVECVIPGRIVHNWDFNKYWVSEPSANFLNEIQLHPLINIRSINPRIYFAVQEMEVVQKLRISLNFLKLYIFTCRDQIKNRLQKMLWPREYLYEHVHLYSLTDLIEVANGTLQELLKKAISICKSHVVDCQLCYQKGFFCEICKKNELIYPFDVDTTYRCSVCKSVYHRECTKKDEECKKCARISERQRLVEDCDL